MSTDSICLENTYPVSPPTAKNMPVAPDTEPTDASSSRVEAARMTDAL